jgi:hypothetical protein
MNKVILIQNVNGRYAHTGYGGGIIWKDSICGAIQFNKLKDAKQYAKDKAEALKMIVKFDRISFVDFVKKAFIHYVKFESGDRYGQIGCIDIYSVWGNSTKEVKEWNNDEKMFTINSYGGRFGSYYGIMGLSGVNSDSLKAQCSEAFSSGENYKRAMTSW